MISLLLLLCSAAAVVAWPDGAPCVSNAFDSMNPLEAVEHQGGLQLSEPPYEIKVDQRCYWRSQPIAFTLQGKNESMWYKGFAIQPFEWNNGVLGKRIGRLLRLDDNGSWQYQCFRFKDSATHSHNQRKKQMKMWWRNDEDEDRFVQFVATVVHSQRRFWVRSVLSPPIPPCRVRRDFGDWRPPPPANPPPVKTFKMEADREFGNFFINEGIPDGVNIADNGGRGNNRFGGSSSFTTPATTSFAFTFQQQQEQQRQRDEERARSEARRQQMERERERENTLRSQQEREQRLQAERARQQQLQQQQQRPKKPNQPPKQQPNQPRVSAQRQRTRQRTQGSSAGSSSPRAHVISTTHSPVPASSNGVCADIDPPTRCHPWAQYCQASTYMHQYCRKTCHFC